MSKNDLLKNINKAGETSLTLFNESGEVYLAGELTTLIHTNSYLKLRYAVTEPFTHALPFTHAAIHTGKRVWDVIAIKPLDNGVVGTELEVRI